MKLKWSRQAREFLLLMTLLLLTVTVNWPIIMFDLMYSEQATIFNANQTIHSFADFIRVYTHPQLLDFMVPFFRPSGHFLMYQLLTPLLGWYNTKALFIVNMLFLGLAGYMMVKLYETLFPGLRVGGYIAFSIYVMNPALLISKVTIMHFEFAYVFFVLWSLYCFVLFCKKNLAASTLKLKFQDTRLFAASIVLYLIAGTFKEASLMLGPVLAGYFIIAIYHPLQMKQVFKNKEVLSILFLLTAVSLTLALYLTMCWQGGLHPGLSSRTWAKTLTAAQQFAVYFFSLTHNYIPEDARNHLVRAAVTPPLTHYIIWGGLFITAISFLNVFRQKNTEFKKSLLFLLLAGILFMLLPLWWGSGFGWHLSLSLVFEAMILGFGVEFYARHFLHNKIINLAGISFAVFIGYAAYQVNQANINYVAAKETGFFSKVNHNAIFHPPALKQFLNDESILVVQDNLNISDYQLGNSSYPFILIPNKHNLSFDNYFTLDQRKLFWRVNPVYNGTLFHWAYASPNFKEEVVPFSNTNMQLIPNAILASWLRHINNIFCVTYDAAGNWFDNTVTFKRNIVLEQKRRHLLIKQYSVLPLTALHSNAAGLYKLPYADPELCKTVCDNNHGCKGFTYNSVVKASKTLAQCFFYNKLSAAKKPCAVCTGYIKSKVS